jgi:hypothetical protein
MMSRHPTPGAASAGRRELVGPFSRRPFRLNIIDRAAGNRFCALSWRAFPKRAFP